MLSILFLLLLPHAISAQSKNLSQQKLNIFILAGQSNMAGRGGIINNTNTGVTTWDGIVPPQCQPNPSIFKLSAKLTWVHAHEPLHADIDVNKTNGVGPGMTFANAVLTRDPNFGVVGLVPCAIGGTNISEWKKGKFLYEQMVRRANVAVQSGGIIRAVLWYQGESDTVNKEDAELYKGRLEKFFKDLREDLQDPMLPIIQVALASGQGPYIDSVREAQLGIDLLNVQCLDAKGLPLEPDGLHLTTPAQVRLGEMFADAFLQFLPSPISISSTSNAPRRKLVRSLPHGKSDTVRREDAEAYKGNMERLTMDLRSDLNIPPNSTDHPGGTCIRGGKSIETVRRAQLGIKLPNVKCVDAKGLQLKKDHLHLTMISELH